MTGVQTCALPICDIEVVLEVCFTTHDTDYVKKDLQYAKAGIPEYVIVDPDRGIAEVRTEPTPLGYLRRSFLTAGDSYRGVPLAAYLDANVRDA